MLYIFFSAMVLCRESASEPSNEAERPVIYVTGFKPFWHHCYNSSQEAVLLLKDTDLEQQLGVKLVTDILLVSYKYIASYVPEMWQKLKPKVSTVVYM